MARTVIVAQAAPGGYGVGVTGMVLVETVADIANFQATSATGREMILAHNTGGVPYTVTITSSADPLGRTGDIATFSIAAGAIAIFGPFPTPGWQQTDGKLYYQANNVAVKFSPITIPPL